jgi:hypothetical protein
MQVLLHIKIGKEPSLHSLSFSTLRGALHSPHSIGHSATISAPHMHAYSLEELEDLLVPGYVNIMAMVRLDGTISHVM